MSSPSLSAELTREHREIDAALQAFIEKLDCGSVQTESLTGTLEALRRHIYLEEVFLFPPLRDAGVVMPIFVMMREHGQLWQTMDALTDLLADGHDGYDSLIQDRCDGLIQDHLLSDRCVVTV